MVEAPSLFESLRITKWYKYLLYLAGVILILSLFFDVKVVEVEVVRQFSISTIVIGVAIWILDDIFKIIITAISGSNMTIRKQNEIGGVVLFFYFLIIFVAFFIWVTSIKL